MTSLQLTNSEFHYKRLVFLRYNTQIIMDYNTQIIMDFEIIKNLYSFIILQIKLSQSSIGSKSSNVRILESKTFKRTF